MDTTTKIVLLLSPLILVEIAMRIFTLFKLRRNPRPKGGKALWAVLIALVTLVWAVYLLVSGSAGEEE